jgi:DNA polymerase-4
MGVSDDLKRTGYLGKTIGLKLRYDNFRTVTRDSTLDWPTDDARAIRRAAGECLKRVPLDRRIRLLGVRAGVLVAAASVGPSPQTENADPTPSLFDAVGWG